MRVKLAEIGSELPLRYAVPFVAVIYAIGLYGFYQVCPAGNECGAGEEPFTFLNNALRTFGLFFSLAEPGHEALRNVWLMTARWIAPCITLFAIFRLFAERLQEWQHARQLRSITDHHLVVGYGQSSRHLIAAPTALVVIDRDELALAGTVLSPQQFTITGDGRDATILQAAQVAKATHMVIMGGSDSENLDVLAQASKLRIGGARNLRVAVRINNPQLAAQLNREDQFVGVDHLDVSAFNLDLVAARSFVAEHTLSEMAHLRALRRVHLVVVGWSEFAFAAVEQFLRISPFAKLEAPRITIVCENATAILQMVEAKFPIFADADFVILTATEIAHGITDQQMAAIEADDPVSAVLVAFDSDDKNAVHALAIRQRSQIAQRWLAPIFARLKSSPALEAMVTTQRVIRNDAALSILAVGQTAQTLSFENLFGAKESLAKAFHETYRNDNPDALPEWDKLSATYRKANMSAADNTVSRLLSSGYVLTEARAVPHGVWDIFRMEELAELTHRSWEIDRRLEGWRYGKTRDNIQMLHPSLRPYEELSDDIKEQDRSQIRLVQKALKQGSAAQNLFKDYIVAAFGHNAVSAEDGENIKLEVTNALRALSVPYFTLVSPLAPGSDSLIVDAALDYLIAQKIPFRLLVIQALPWTVVCNEQAKLHHIDCEILQHTRAAILEKAGVHAHIIHLELPGITPDMWTSKPALRIAAYRKANQWMVDRAQHVLCHLRDGQKALPGGTAEAFATFTKKKIKVDRV